MKTVTILGTKYEFVKTGMIALQTIKYSQARETAIHTSQHPDIFLNKIKNTHIERREVAP